MSTLPPLSLLALNVKNLFDDGRFKEALEWLPISEHAHVNRFRFDADKHRALGSLLLRRYFFSKFLGVPWKELCFDRRPGSKPTLKIGNDTWVDYNTSHEGEWVVFVATSRPGLVVGIDCVRIDIPLHTDIPQFLRSFQSQLSTEEIEWIFYTNEENNMLKRFYELWGCKESYVKAIGAWIVMQEDNWGYHLSDLDNDTIVVVCSGYPDKRPLDHDILAFCATTRPLGATYHQQAPFELVRWEALSNYLH
ncbi:hypothetical protein J3Q64DRAFT_1841527 [Phycomyces blakesleeanus]|uniref:holo-[acyl-carrier-protein] synthase n=1 Tax=Phycomyces blakesleeanus TaxID=4837 RepID=A0ABR3AK26_PHYBL